MRLLPSRFASHLSLGIILPMALVLAGAAMEVDGIDRDLHARVTRGGVQRLDADGGHIAGDVEGAALTVAEQAAADQSLATLSMAAFGPPAPPTDFVWLPDFAPVAPATTPSTAPTRGRAPPAS
jgi:hypothetical protein